MPETTPDIEPIIITPTTFDMTLTKTDMVNMHMEALKEQHTAQLRTLRERQKPIVQDAHDKFRTLLITAYPLVQEYRELVQALHSPFSVRSTFNPDELVTRITFQHQSTYFTFWYKDPGPYDQEAYTFTIETLFSGNPQTFDGLKQLLSYIESRKCAGPLYIDSFGLVNVPGYNDKGTRCNEHSMWINPASTVGQNCVSLCTPFNEALQALEPIAAEIRKIWDYDYDQHRTKIENNLNKRILSLLPGDQIAQLTAVIQEDVTIPSLPSTTNVED